MLFVRKAGGWQQLSAATTGPLAAGTQLKLTAVGSTISFLVNGVQQMSVTDTTLTGGAPGILAHDHSTADNWAGGAASGTGGGGSRRSGGGGGGGTSELSRSGGLLPGFPGRWSCRTTAAMISPSAATARSRSPPRWPTAPVTRSR